LFFVNGSESRSGDEEIMNKASRDPAVSKCSLGWNTTTIIKIIAELRAPAEIILEWRGSHG